MPASYRIQLTSFGGLCNTKGEMDMIGFIIGIALGSMLTMITMSLVLVAKKADYASEQMKVN